MNTQTIISKSIFLAMLFFLASCNDDDDADPSDETSAPTATIERPESGESRKIHADDEYGHMHFRVTFKDDTELGEFEIDIHNAFDGHDHGGKNFAPFHLHETHDITGTRDTFVDYDIEIPASVVSGKYHLTLRATDRAGNSLDVDGADFINVEFYIENENFGPVWDITSPEHEQTFNLHDDISLEGLIKGFVEIEEIWVSVSDENGNVVYDWSRDHLHTENYNLSRNIHIDDSWGTGTFYIDIEVELENEHHYHMEPITIYVE